MTRLLIVSPGFHGYYAAIARAFAGLGYEVITNCYDATATPTEKAWNKLRHELPSRLRGEARHLSPETVSRRAAAQVREISPDRVLVIRGDVLTEEFWAEAHRHGRPVVTWMYDELRRTSFDASMVGRYASLATYSALDAAALRSQGHDALHVPLGFDDSAHRAPTNLGRGIVSFVGAPSEKRRAALGALMGAGIPVHAWGRGWSDHPFDRVRTWRVGSAGIPAGRDIPGGITHSVMRNSVATLNIHGDQDGFTMRTFEAAGSGAVQLVDRADVEEFYEPGREVLVYRDHEELIAQSRQVLAHPKYFSDMRAAAEKRTLTDHTLRHRAALLQTAW